ncbi:Hypothetical predicted protein [Olea europaea subsp. europaea]|uniref:Uncharacterized protein n=1 Tax=Olea europaea subsp. europaea TaxID=158383 RepID=A0A8S0RRM8_OLEEU|nr:Hypothetical predicted protein [Olea europaea subsp. europaea]
MGSGTLVLVWSHPSVIAVRAYLMSVQRRERSQPRRDKASDCGVRGAGGYRKRGASGERLAGRDRGRKLLKRREGERSQQWRDRASDCGVRGAGGDRKQGASGERLEGRDRGKKLLQRREGAGSDSNRGGTGPAIVGSAEPATIESEGPAGSAWRGGIAEKIALATRRSSAGSDRNRGGTGPTIVGSTEPAAIESEGPAGSVIAVRAYLISVQRRKQSQPRRDWANDCGVRGAGGDRKRGASRVRLERRDRGKKLLQRREGAGSDRNCGGTGPAIVGSAEPTAIGSEGPAGSSWRGGIGEKNCFNGEKGSDSNLRGTGPAIVRSAEPTAIESEGPAESAWRRGIGEKNFFSGERSSAGSDRNRGGTAPAIVGSAEPMAIESKGPAGSAWRGGIAEKNCFSGEKVIAVRAYLMSVQRRERSQSRRTVPAIVGSAEPAAIESEEPAGSAWRGGIGEKIPSAGSDSNRGSGQRMWGPRSRRRSKARG